MGVFSIWHLLVILAIVLVIFGTKKIRDLGGDLGGAIKNFKQAVKEEESEASVKKENNNKAPRLEKKPVRVIEGKVTSKQRKKKA